MALKISRATLVRAVNVILRVPALFIAEVWWRNDSSMVQNHFKFGNIQGRNGAGEVIAQLLYYLALLFCIALTVLPLRKLVNFYMYILSAMLLSLAHYLSSQYVLEEKAVFEATLQHTAIFDDADCVHRLGIHLAMQGMISAVVIYLLQLKAGYKIFVLSYTLPIFARVADISMQDLSKVHNFSSLCVILVSVFFLFNHIPYVLDIAKAGMNQVSMAIQLYGWIPFIVAMWFKILLPVQFLIFWSVLFMVQLYKYLSVANHPILSEGWVVLILASTGECCVTPVSLMGLCVTVSYLSYMILTLTKLYLRGREAFIQDNVMHRGWTEGFTMFLLAIQTGLIELRPPQRAFLMSIVLFIVLSSLIQSVYEITDPFLLELGASQNRNKLKHVRAIVLCTALWMFPLYMTYAICQFFELDFWLMVVVSSCILTSVQVLGSLVIYSLFVYDAIITEPWENLDDVVYYAKATTRVLEFMVALFVVCYGVRESVFGEWSWVNSSILLIHCYFNVWQRLQAGWRSYLQRREAVKRVESLPTATLRQLQDHNDVCAICYQELKTARITPCRHFFHGLCLRKWLHVQERCPLCHQLILLVADGEEPPQSHAAQPDINHHQQEPVAEQHPGEGLHGAADNGHDERHDRQANLSNGPQGPGHFTASATAAGSGNGPQGPCDFAASATAAGLGNGPQGPCHFAASATAAGSGDGEAAASAPCASPAPERGSQPTVSNHAT